MIVSEIKSLLLQACKQRILANIKTASEVQERLNSSLFGETKSSAGDKFETSRAMLQAEQERIKAVLIKSKRLEQKLNTLSIIPSAVIREGSLVSTETANYFIAIAMGKIEVNGQKYFVLSAQSPMGALLINKSAGDRFSFNSKEHHIITVQ